MCTPWCSASQQHTSSALTVLTKRNEKWSRAQANNTPAHMCTQVARFSHTTRPAAALTKGNSGASNPQSVWIHNWSRHPKTTLPAGPFKGQSHDAHPEAGNCPQPGQRSPRATLSAYCRWPPNNSCRAGEPGARRMCVWGDQTKGCFGASVDHQIVVSMLYTLELSMCTAGSPAPLRRTTDMLHVKGTTMKTPLLLAPPARPAET